VFGDLLERGRIKIVLLLPATPKRNDKLGFDQKAQVLGHSLSRHRQMLTKLGESLAIVLVKLVEKPSTTGISERLKNLIHAWGNLCNQMVACQDSPYGDRPKAVYFFK